MKLHRGVPQVNVLELRDQIRSQLIQVLDSVRGTKALVIDTDLSGPLSYITDISLLREHGVEKVYYLEASPPQTDLQSVLYIARPKIPKIKWIADHIKSSGSESKNYTLYMVPRRTLLCERILEEEGVLGDLTLGEFRMDFVPLERDLLSLELGGTFKDLYLDGDFSGVYYAARGLMSLQGRYGFFPRIVGKGDYAQILGEILDRMRRELSSTDRNDVAQSKWAISEQFDSLVIIDRATDLVTPLLTPLSYEGLIDEVFGIKNGCAELESATSITDSRRQAGDGQTGTTENVPKKQRITLNDTDEVYTHVRGQNLSAVGHVLNRLAKDLQDKKDLLHKAKTTRELRQFADKIGEIQASRQSLQTRKYNISLAMFVMYLSSAIPYATDTSVNETDGTFIDISVVERIIKRTQSDDFNQMLEVEQKLGKEEISFLEQISALGDPSAAPPPSNGITYSVSQIPKPPSNIAPNSIYKLLRLLCLYYLTGGTSFKAKMYDQWCNEVLMAFGYQHRVTLNRLSSVGLFGPVLGTKTISLDAVTRSRFGFLGSEPVSGAQKTKKIPTAMNPSTKPRHPAHNNTFAYLRKTLNLCSEDVEVATPTDISYLYSGYAPLSIRLLQCLTRDEAVTKSTRLRRQSSAQRTTDPDDHGNHHSGPNSDTGGISGGWKGWEDVLAEVPGKTVDIIQRPKESTSSLFLSDSSRTVSGKDIIPLKAT
ncbi:Vacuolar protein-sorting-associated protein 33 [Mycoemilia scoparia]|uniref:Vacuolar protein-sorting-associated protein 33 n=1 Tax=Mycoemilia scoparia TaxID=417184 RepID=A0A9W8DXF2_9FUNG|nr:Vacuolar protein-sorting-associated protein 33 [Mycoemilia scoparia]